MKAKQFLSTVLLSSSSLLAAAQDKIFTGFLSPNIDNSVYTAMQNLWYANERPSYFCPSAIIHPKKDPVIPLQEGEGTEEVQVFEGNMYFQIPIAMGRNHGTHFWQTSRLTFNAGFNLRMAPDQSNPLIPNNNIFGLTLDKVIWDSHTGYGPFRKSLRYAFENWKDKGEPLQNLSMEATLNHYSNGQPPGFYLHDTIGGVPLQRNDYRKGDFSTNYGRIGLTYSHLSEARNMFSANLAYQWDGTLGGPFSYSSEQRKSYGHYRFTSHLQYRWLIRRANRYTWVYDVCNEDILIESVRYYHEVTIRYEPSIILGDMSNYHAPDSHLHRWGHHLFIQYTRPNWRAFGLLLHLYSGRDYSNIRYDLPINAAMVGLSMNFNKYYPALKESQRFQ